MDPEFRRVNVHGPTFAVRRFLGPPRPRRASRARTSYVRFVRPRARRSSVCETFSGGPGPPDSESVEFIRGADRRDVLPPLPGPSSTPASLTAHGGKPLERLQVIVVRMQPGR